jgi:ribosomal RNA assembly protein
METFYIKKIQDVKKNLSDLEEKLNVKITIQKNQIMIKGPTLEEFDASRVFEAIAFGFSVKKAIVLKNEEYLFRTVKIKDHTKRNLSDIKSRLIGKKGKTKRVFADTSGCEILISESEVGIIGLAEDVQNVETAIINLIRGSKQTNMYRYLEKQNQLKKENTPFIDLKQVSKEKKLK